MPTSVWHTANQQPEKDDIQSWKCTGSGVKFPLGTDLGSASLPPTISGKNDPRSATRANFTNTEQCRYARLIWQHVVCLVVVPQHSWSTWVQHGQFSFVVMVAILYLLLTMVGTVANAYINPIQDVHNSGEEWRIGTNPTLNIRCLPIDIQAY